MAEFVEISKDGVVYTVAPHLGVRHAFTTRIGGVDTGSHRGLNLGQSRTDDPKAVRENYRRLCAAVGLDDGRLSWGRQVHGTVVLKTGEGDICRLFGERRDGDGLVSDVPGLGLMVYTADCVPILLSDPVTGAVAALHAGWRGTVDDMAGAGVRAMAEHYGTRPGDIRAAVGPGIGPCCFQVGQEVTDAVEAVLGPEGAAFIRPLPAEPFIPRQDSLPNREEEGKFYVDLKGVNRALLIRAGVRAENIAVSGECTRCAPERYWSHRRHGVSRGSQGAVIAAN